MGEKKRIDGFGGLQKRDFIHTSMVSRAFYLSTFVDDIENKIINIGTGRGTRIQDLAKIIAGFHPGTKVTFKERSDHLLYHSVADITLARKLIGFRPDQTVKYFKKMLKEIDEHESKS